MRKIFKEIVAGKFLSKPGITAVFPDPLAPVTKINIVSNNRNVVGVFHRTTLHARTTQKITAPLTIYS